MTEKLIHIGKRYDNVSKKNNKPYLKIIDGQSEYSCWEPTLFPKLLEGKEVNCRIESNGKFTNILDILPDDGQAYRPPVKEFVWTRELVEKLFVGLKRMEDKIDNLELVDGTGKPIKAAPELDTIALEDIPF